MNGGSVSYIVKNSLASKSYKYINTSLNIDLTIICLLVLSLFYSTYSLQLLPLPTPTFNQTNIVLSNFSTPSSYKSYRTIYIPAQRKFEDCFSSRKRLILVHTLLTFSFLMLDTLASALSTMYENILAVSGSNNTRNHKNTKRMANW